MIVLHYTGMPDAEGALDRLTSPEAQVSAHYLIDEDGTTYRLVDEVEARLARGQVALARDRRRQFGERRDRDRQSRP